MGLESWRSGVSNLGQDSCSPWAWSCQILSTHWLSKARPSCNSCESKFLFQSKNWVCFQKKSVLILWLCCFLHNPSSPTLIFIFPSHAMRAGTVIFQHLTPTKPRFLMKISFYFSLAFSFFIVVGGPVLLCFCPYPGREKNNKSGKQLLYSD